MDQNRGKAVPGKGDADLGHASVRELIARLARIEEAVRCAEGPASDQAALTERGEAIVEELRSRARAAAPAPQDPARDGARTTSQAQGTELFSAAAGSLRLPDAIRGAGDDGIGGQAPPCPGHPQPPPSQGAAGPDAQHDGQRPARHDGHRPAPSGDTAEALTAELRRVAALALASALRNYRESAPPPHWTTRFILAALRGRLPHTPPQDEQSRVLQSPTVKGVGSKRRGRRP